MAHCKGIAGDRTVPHVDFQCLINILVHRELKARFPLFPMPLQQRPVIFPSIVHLTRPGIWTIFILAGQGRFGLRSIDVEPKGTSDFGPQSALGT
jgi:hypothetical protein